MLDPIESFRPDANAVCVCGGAKLFKNCCGSSAIDRKPPAGMILQKAFLPADTCGKLVEFVTKQSASGPLKVVAKNSSVTKAVHDVVNNDRVTTRIDLQAGQAKIDKWVADIFYKLLAKKIGKKIRSYSSPDLMRYTSGGYYKPHSDSELFDKNTGKWNKVLDRDYSLLLYLNDDFEGGAVHFTHFNYTFKPRKGDLLIFPSHHLYLHEAQLVESGVRYVIVSWANLK
jgi:hypothetical protein